MKTLKLKKYVATAGITLCLSLPVYAEQMHRAQQAPNKNGAADVTLQHGNAEGMTASQAMIKNKISKKLASIDSAIDVKVKDGVAHLQGKLATDTDYEKAIMLTESTQGVSDVNADQLTVKDSKQPLTDTYVTAKVKGKLLKENLFGQRDIDSWNISVETKNGNVFLSGIADSSKERNEVATIAKSVKGVVKVENDIQIKPNH